MQKRPKSQTTVDAVVLTGEGDSMAILVVKRRFPPFAGEWALPGGFIEKDESPTMALVRELKEETGIDISPIRAIPLRSRGLAGRDPRGWIITIPFLFVCDEQLPLTVSEETTEVAWIFLRDLKKLAFDHGSLLCEALALYWPTFSLYSSPFLNGKQAFGAPKKTFKKVTLFGGTFNPWHQGHRACVDLFPHKEELVVIPDRNPWKQLNHLSCAWEHFSSLKRELDGTSAWVFPGFAGPEFKNPTFDWTLSLSIPFSLLLGDDCFITLPLWSSIEKLLSRLESLWVVPREAPVDKREEIRCWIEKEYPQLKIYWLEEHPYRQLSSTELRKKKKI